MATYTELGLYIDGKWSAGSEGRSEPVINPANEQVLGHVPHASKADLDLALAAAQRAFPLWRDTPLETRTKILLTAARMVRERAPRIGEIMTLEQGKALTEARGEVQRDLFSYSLEWPDGSRMDRVSFQSRDAQDKGLQHVSLEDTRIRRLVQQLPRVIVTEPIPCVRFASLPAEVVGYWSLWRIAIDKQSLRDVKIIPIFHHDDGRNLGPTARHIWDALMEDRPEVDLVDTKSGAEVEAVFRRLRSEAERLGEDAFHDLHARQQQRLKREQEKGNYAFQVRREALGRLGLPEVRQHRLKRLAEEERAWAAELRKREHILPELQPVILLRVEAGNG